MRSVLTVFGFCFLAACSGSETAAAPINKGHDMDSDKELIVVASPLTGDAYYADAASDIFDFHVAYGQAVLEFDDFLVLTDDTQYEAYVRALGADHVAIAPQDDIWMRDFSLSNAENPVMFRYTAAGQGGGRKGQRDADHVQEGLAETMEAAGVRFADSDLLNDGGNYVDDYHGRVVISRKFLVDNGLSEAAARAVIRKSTGTEHVAFIEADEQGGLEHADGVVAFIEPGILVVNSYFEDPEYAAALKADLRAGLPGVEIHEITTPYDGSEIYDDKFGSACGLYTNMLVTPERIYLPQFGIPEDAQALSQVRALTDKHVVPVRSDTVCYMGGGVRCMSWQVRGANAEMMKAWASRASKP